MTASFGVLGPLEARDDQGEPLAIRGSRRRSLLLRLIIDANRVLSADTLLDDVWADSSSPASAGTLQSHISLLRRTLGGQLEFQAPGYVLHVPAGGLDSWAYEAELIRARELLAGGEAPRSAAVLRSALARWRGPALADVVGTVWAVPEVTRLTELRAGGVELMVKALLLVADDSEAVSLAEWAVTEHPLREHLWAHLMMGLARQGRNAEALRAYQRLRQHLVDGMGLDPSPYLASLERAVLAQQPIDELWRIWQSGALEHPSAVALPHTSAGDDERTQPAPRCDPPAATSVAGTVAGDGTVVRAEQVAALRRAAEHVVADQAGLTALVTGEPGAGRSTLLAQAVPVLSDLGFGIAGPFRAGAGTSDLLELAARLRAEHGDGPPLAVMVDDAHRADAGWVAALEDLRAAAGDLPVLVVVTVRDTHVGSGHPAHRLMRSAGRDPSVITVALPGLSEEEVGLLVVHHRRMVGAEAAAVTAGLRRLTGGNPALTVSLLDQPDDGLLEPALVPAVTDLVEDWTRSLEPRARTTLDVLALAGTQMDLQSLARVLGRPPVDVMTAIDELDRLALLAYHPEGLMRVRLPVVAQVLVASLPTGRRVLLSAQLAAPGPDPGFVERRSEERRVGDRRRPARAPSPGR